MIGISHSATGSKKPQSLKKILTDTQEQKKLIPENFGGVSHLKITPISHELTPKAKKWVNQLFLRLGVIYGAKFAAQYRGMKIDLVKYEWGEAIRNFDGDIIRSVLDDLRNAHSICTEWPPTIPEFVAMAKNIEKRKKLEKSYETKKEPALIENKTIETPAYLKCREDMEKMGYILKPRG